MSTSTDGRKPQQDRSRKTYERLLDVTGQLLEEVGVDRVSTNLVAERAGVSPPTVYHYFADKYALFRALGERLMAAQNALVTVNFHQPEAEIAATLLDHVRLTRNFPGGIWVMRMLRAVPQLSEVRLESHRALAGSLVDQAMQEQPEGDRETLERIVRLAIEIGYAAVEMALEEPGIDMEATMQLAARAIRSLPVGEDGR
jgi:AcrR family transcriptional regulator